MRRAAWALALLLVPRVAAAQDPEDPPPPASAPSEGIGVRAVAAGGVSNLLHLPFTGWSGALGVGGEVGKNTEFYVSFSYGQARTSNGLGLREGTLDGTLTTVVGPVHLGLGGGFVYMQIPRISEPSIAIQRLGLGLDGWASVDILKPTPRQALFVALRPEADWVVPQLLLRATLGLGYRF